MSLWDNISKKIKSMLSKKEKETFSFLNNIQNNGNLEGDRVLSTQESTRDFLEKYNSYFKIDPNQFLYKGPLTEEANTKDDNYDLSMYNADDLSMLIEACISNGNDQIARYLVSKLKPLIIINSGFTLSDDSVEWLINKGIITNKALYCSKKISRYIKFKLEELSHSEEFHIKNRLIEHALSYYNLKGIDFNTSISIMYDTFMYNNVPDFMKTFELYKYSMSANLIQLNEEDWIKKFNELFLIALENKDKSIDKIVFILEKGNEILHNSENYINASSIAELDFYKLSDIEKALFIQYVDTVCTLHNLACVNKGDIENIVTNINARVYENDIDSKLIQKQTIMREIVAKYNVTIEQFSSDMIIDHVFFAFPNLKKLSDLKNIIAEYEKVQESSDKTQGELYYICISRNGWNGFLKDGNVAETFKLLQTCEEASKEYKKDITDTTIKLLKLEDINNAFNRNNVNLLVVYRKQDLEKRFEKSGDSREVKSGNSNGKQFIEVNSGIGTLMVDHIIAREWSYLYERELAIANIYIPVYNEKNELIFSRETFDRIREKEMQGLSYYGTGKYYLDSRCTNIEPLIDIYRELCKRDGDEECERIIEGIRNIIEGKENKEDIKKQEIVYGYIQKIINNTRNTSVNGINDSLANRIVEIVESGSTARGTNKPGESDFDYTIKADNVNRIREALAKALLSEDEARKTIEKKGEAIHAKEVKIGNEKYDIDITFVPKTLQIGLSVDMAVEDRLHSIKEQYPKQYNYVIANIVLAKVILKKLGIYKKFMSEGATIEGGLGGIGVENWILQEGGSFQGAMEEFLKNATDEYGNVRKVKEMQQIYPIMEFGTNHISRNNDEMGYDKRKSFMPRTKSSYLGTITEYGINKFVKAFEEIVGYCENNTRKKIKIEPLHGLLESIFSPKRIIENRPEVVESYPEVQKLLAKHGFKVSLLMRERFQSAAIYKKSDKKGDDINGRT